MNYPQGGELEIITITANMIISLADGYKRAGDSLKIKEKVDSTTRLGFELAIEDLA